MSSGTELIYNLKKRGGFWSYSEDILDTIPDSILIEEALRRGEVKDIKLLFDLFSKKKLNKYGKKRLSRIKEYMDIIITWQRFFLILMFLAAILNLSKKNITDMNGLKMLLPDTEKVLQQLSTLTLLDNYSFVGGSALTIYLSHRYSEDIDLFTWDTQINSI